MSTVHQLRCYLGNGGPGDGSWFFKESKFPIPVEEIPEYLEIDSPTFNKKLLHYYSQSGWMFDQEGNVVVLKAYYWYSGFKKTTRRKLIDHG